MLILWAILLISTGCGRPSVRFSDVNARAHIEMLAGSIGSRPIGTAANARARTYLIEQLRLYGFDVRIQETDAKRPELGLTARVSNVIASRAGTRPGSIGLVAHYDSTPSTPGAGDDALGVAVTLEAARILTDRRDRNYGLIVLLTDGEEEGLMGAAGLIEDRVLREDLLAYLNFEAIGASGPALLFETGPGNDWIAGAWARSAPEPRGSSYALEVYERLPNDTDFSIFKCTGVPGLNFAAVGDSRAYHTARDTPDRVSTSVIRQMGANAVAIVEDLDRRDLSVRSPEQPAYFDVSGAFAVSYGPRARRLLSGAAAVLAFAAGVRAIVVVWRLVGLWRLLATGAWAILALAAVFGAMVFVVWALRAARGVQHPWYAHPDRLFWLLVTTAVVAGWSSIVLASILPRRMRAAAHPSAVWSVTLPVWAGIAVLAEWKAPAASHLWTVPLLAAGVLLAAAPLRHTSLVRLISLLVLAVTATLWARETRELLLFAVSVLGRMPIVTPVFVYPALILAASVMIAPPLVATWLQFSDRLPAPRALVTTVAFTILAIVAGLSFGAPAYTREQPLRHGVRYLHDGATGQAFWEIDANEEGVSVLPPATDFPWRRVAAPLERRRAGPFIYRAAVTPLTVPPASFSGFVTERAEENRAGGCHPSARAWDQSDCRGSRRGLATAFELPWCRGTRRVDHDLRRATG